MTLGALRSKGFGQCSLDYVEEVAPEYGEWGIYADTCGKPMLQLSGSTWHKI